MKVLPLIAAWAAALPITATAQSSAAVEAHLAIRADRPGAIIDRHIYGQFAEHLGNGIYEGIWVGGHSKIPNQRGFRNDVIGALRELKVPVVRWPGGCFADEYHWRDGIGPRADRPVKVNTHWGGVAETNEFGTHEFMTFAEMIGTNRQQPLICRRIKASQASPPRSSLWSNQTSMPAQRSALHSFWAASASWEA